MNENISMFDEGTTIATTKNLNVVFSKFGCIKKCDYEDLFYGFDKMYAITFSSGVNFTCSLLEHFKYAEIIFGSEMVIPNEFEKIVAYQSKIIDRIRTGKKYLNMLYSRIDDKSLELHVSRGQLSHAKIYLLEANDGRKRVITGSANMSYNAFSGLQTENFTCYDNDEDAFAAYMEVYNELKEKSTDNITHKALDLSNLTDHFDEIPICQTIKNGKAFIIEPSTSDNKDIEFYLDVNNISKDVSKFMPKETKKGGKILCTPETIRHIKRNIITDEKKKNDIAKEAPQLIVNVYEGTATLNNQILDLNPSAEDVKRDAELFVQYMDGFSSFHGDTEDLQARYYEFANWFFCSPFMANMRYVATKYDKIKTPYPVYGILYGKSKAGKTTFPETLLKMMIGQKVKIAAPEFTRKSIAGLKSTSKGAPIIVDDLTKKRFDDHAVETIKYDDFGINQELLYYPAVVISANEDLKVIDQQILRRSVVCRVNAASNNKQTMQNSVADIIQKKFGTALYREYLRRMLEVVPNLIELLMDNENTETPDILKLSSDVLMSIFREHIETLPEYIHEISMFDYFDDKTTGQYAIKEITSAWKTSKKQFKILRKTNELKYNAADNIEAKRIEKVLPEELGAFKSGTWIIMNLTEAEKYFDIKFKKLF